MRNILTLIALCFSTVCHAQTLSEDRDKIEAATNSLTPAIKQFASCTQQGDDGCAQDLVKAAKNEYDKYIIGGALYQAYPEQSFRLHHEAYVANPNNLFFNLEYAIELHRKGDYKGAAELYEKYSSQKPDDIRLYVWLADCYINTGDVDKAITNWNKAGHASKHTSIDFAINTIYGDTTKVKKRSSYRKLLGAGTASAVYPLIFLDANWETDWWNTTVLDDAVSPDMALAKSILKEDSQDYKIVAAYIAVKKMTQTDPDADKIKQLLTANNLVIGKGIIPAYGPMASDLLRICFINKLIEENQFYKDRGAELLQAARATKDKELMNIYAYLQGAVNGRVDAATDLAGWKDFHDERFAASYFMGKGAKNKYDDPELAQAITDFPNSSTLYWIKANCAKVEHKPMKPTLVELIKRDFKTLQSGGDERSSYPLNSFFGALQNEK
jgi:tetratricopeptide (TPR) repeat protein